MAARSVPLAGPVLGWARVRPLAWLLRADAAHRSRQRLADLDPHLLADIGLTVAQAAVEADRAGWDAPSHWLR